MPSHDTMSTKAGRRTILTAQLALASLALISLALTLWAFSIYVGRWSFSLSLAELNTIVTQSEMPGLSALGPGGAGRIVAVAVSNDVSADTLLIYLPLATTIVSILGFLSATLLAWRKERREIKRDSLEIERLRLEIEQLRLQIEKGKEPSTP